MEQDKQASFTMRVDATFLDALDRGRLRQLPPMTRSDYIRKLVLENDRNGQAIRGSEVPKRKERIHRLVGDEG